MTKTRKNSTRRRKYSRRRKYVKKKYSKKKYRNSNLKQNRKKNKKRNMKGGLVTLIEFDTEKEISVLKGDDQETQVPEGSLVIKDDDLYDYLHEGEFNSIQMREWLKDNLNGIDSPDDIKLYKGGKADSYEFTGDGEEDAENNITIYVKLPPESGTTTSATTATTAVVDTSNKSSEAELPLAKIGRLTAAEERLETLKREAEIYGEGFLGTGIILCYTKKLCDLSELRSFYNLYIRDENINRKNSKGLTMINSAVLFKLYPIIDFLLNIPDININGNEAEDNPLLFSMFLFHYEPDVPQLRHEDLTMVRYLLNKKLNGGYMFDVNILDSDGKTPLEIASLDYKNKFMVACLIERNVAPEIIEKCKIIIKKKVIQYKKEAMKKEKAARASEAMEMKSEAIIYKEIFDVLNGKSVL
jgi:hypothetical protein